jgi:hypothetical protein
MIGNFGGCFGEDPFGIKRRIVDKVRKELRYASDKKLRAIFRAYDRLPFYRKYFIQPCKEEYWFEKNLRASTAEALLLGKLNWGKVERYEAEQIKRKQKEELEEKHRELMLERGRAIEFFTGSLEEFESYKKERYEVVGMQVYIPAAHLKESEEGLIKLVEKGVEAFIRSEGDLYHPFSNGIIGIPVRKKEK